MGDKKDIVDWLVNNSTRINPIIQDMKNAKSKLIEMEHPIFHDDIIKEFNDMTVQKIADLITEDLAIPIDTVYSIIEDNGDLVKALDRGIN
jgi:hypothetical protein